MKKYLFFLLIFLAVGTKNYAQFTRYIIQLKNKAGTPYSLNNPIQFLTQRSIDRRIRYSIPIDSTDLPIPPAYIDSILSAGSVTLLNTSKWLNQVCIQTSDAAALNKINTFPFVITTAPIAARPVISASATSARPVINSIVNNVQARPAAINATQDYYSYGYAYAQIHLHQGEFLHDHGFLGNSMIITFTDDGFYHYQTLPTFDSIRNNNQILGTWDFVALDTDVTSLGAAHGTECLSTIAANIPGSFVGSAPQTSFYLFRTEDASSEYPVEEQNWAAAAERADSLGTDLISVSLGYTVFDSSRFNHTYNDLNGHKTLIARAANLAARKGILVVAAAGNEGGFPWHYIVTPADADSALTVGGVDTLGVSAWFSSYGPNSSGQIKPDVAAVASNAVVADANTGAPTYSNGTSFATPIMAGLSTCLWEAFPEVNNMNIINILHQASNRTNNPDDRTGYGIPDMKDAFVLLIQQLHSFQSTVSGTSVTLNWSAKSASDMNFVVERKLATDINYQPIDTQSANTGFQTNSFSYTDNLPANEAYSGILYRLKMNIAADTSFYLDSATVPSSDGKIVVAPNPVSDNLTITIVRSSNTRIDINLFTSGGQKVYSLSNQQGPGTGTYTIPFKNLASGTYFAVIYCNNQKFATEKIAHP
jgi:serine protease AprX